MLKDIEKDKYLQKLKDDTSFSRSDLLEAMNSCGIEISDASFKVELQQLLNSGAIARVGRNAYCVAEQGANLYHYDYSQKAEELADVIMENHPYLNFTIMELRQLNEFTNHQFAHNVYFVAVEDDLGEFVFDTLKSHYPGMVLINPTPDIYHQYWYDDMIVIQKLVTEAPMGQKKGWHTRIEKLLVDIMADKILCSSISHAEYPEIFTDAFGKYIIDESCMFRYAKRRGASDRMRRFIVYETGIRLRLG
ncbi:MAG: hypothetical protein IJM37_09015 [Lachnospiraceae bacterium]|nr:hypothetical protein [Lachnospiraceae bacterium]